ncbi:RiPP maturation radical SAM protein 1 [Mesorhizobium sp. B3-1-9]|uniref:RiPP maturation radical SAM C-methyltransferase n=1 Tax=Mesorhizobium sp. B3-1-9 TaxID=2589892 RepID=UPI00112B5652|nr:RiPP maturation radical SAM C-methyltransferase [Mesorhizobium sp. B3-1-9]TPI27751.1 RiPP maturation radical SAM protein 1 [Mesorhizobium sp. B3-1-9]
MTNLDAVLINMPFAAAEVPNIGLSLLKSAASEAGFTVRIEYPNLVLYDVLGHDLYTLLSYGFPSNTDLLGEWVFARHFLDARLRTSITSWHEFWRLTRQRMKSHRLYVERTAPLIERFFSGEDDPVFDQVEAFVQKCVETLLESGTNLFGFSTTFQQSVSSLVVAERIKKLQPDSTIIFGGANCERPMGDAIARNYTFIDAVVSGEGEQAIVDILRRVQAGGRPLRHYHSSVEGGPAPAIIEDVNALPYPNYDDYFEAVLTSPRQMVPSLLVEGSRGCWWGERSHCTFCGLNAMGMTFRSKTAGRLADEIETLSARFDVTQINLVDNIIDLKWLDVLGDRLSQTSLSLFVETKANLSRTLVHKLRHARINRIQPGIESLSDLTLKRMKKGVSALANVQLLKLSALYGLDVSWNIIFGFPGEVTEDYQQNLQWISLLTHLQPPEVATDVRVDRYSPLFVALENPRPYPAYFDVFTLKESRDYVDLAYYFLPEHLQPELAFEKRRVIDAVAHWQATAQASVLTMSSEDDHHYVIDTRVAGREHFVEVGRTEREILAACSERVTRDRLAASFVTQPDPEDFQASLGGMLNAGWIIERDGALLSLVLQEEEFASDEWLRRVASRLKGRSIPKSDRVLPWTSAFDAIDVRRVHGSFTGSSQTER